MYRPPYVRPYGPRAAWNVPVKNIPVDLESAKFCRVLLGSTGNRNINLSFVDYTYPVYYVSPGMAEWTVKSLNPSWGNVHNTKMPYSPEWMPGAGSDAQVIVLDPATGREWNLWQVKPNAATKLVTVRHGSLVGKSTKPDGIVGDYRTKENGWRPSRGCGIQYLAMLVQPEEIEAGVIRHALSMPIPETDGGRSFLPATKIEHPSHPKTWIPEGCRFSLVVSDAEINAWLNNDLKALPTNTKTAARIIAVALRDYGWFITDTSVGPHLQFESRATADAKWKALGLGTANYGAKVSPTDLLDGLLSRTNLGLRRIRAHAPEYRYPARARM